MEKFLDITFNNPIFLTATILVVWFAPGIILRRIAEKKYQEKKRKLQSQRISSLYPKRSDS